MMSVNLKTARNFVYANGTLLERALFAYLFQKGSLERLHQIILAHKNPDGGFGHGLEHDIRCPQSHPLALEFLLGMMVQLGIPPGDVFDGTAAWVEANRNPDGSLMNPPEVLDYPHMAHWDGGGQTIPDSIVANFARLRIASETLRTTTADWVQANLSSDKIRANDWLFMAYHAYDYYSAITTAPEYPARWAATVENIVMLAQSARPDQYYEIFRFAPDANSAIAQALPTGLLHKMLDHLETAQQPDGSWHDEHELPQWYPYTTILVLHGLRSHGRDIGTL